MPLSAVRGPCAQIHCVQYAEPNSIMTKSRTNHQSSNVKYVSASNRPMSNEYSVFVRGRVCILALLLHHLFGFEEFWHYVRNVRKNNCLLSKYLFDGCEIHIRICFIVIFRIQICMHYMSLVLHFLVYAWVSIFHYILTFQFRLIN